MVERKRKLFLVRPEKPEQVLDVLFINLFDASHIPQFSYFCLLRSDLLYYYRLHYFYHFTFILVSRKKFPVKA